MYLKLIKSLILLFFLFNSFGQNIDSFEARYNKDNIIRMGSGGYMKAGVKLKFADLRNEFNLSSLGMELYQNARKSKTKVSIYNYTSISSLLASLLIASNTTDASKNGLTASLILLGANLVFIKLGNEQKKHFLLQVDQALMERNKQALFH